VVALGSSGAGPWGRGDVVVYAGPWSSRFVHDRMVPLAYFGLVLATVLSVWLLWKSLRSRSGAETWDCCRWRQSSGTASLCPFRGRSASRESRVTLAWPELYGSHHQA
jgi:hypothetical protein